MVSLLTVVHILDLFRSDSHCENGWQSQGFPYVLLTSLFFIHYLTAPTFFCGLLFWPAFSSRAICGQHGYEKGSGGGHKLTINGLDSAPHAEEAIFRSTAFECGEGTRSLLTQQITAPLSKDVEIREYFC